MGQKVVTAAYNHFQNDALSVKLWTDHYQKYIPAHTECNDLEENKLYKQAVKSFRMNMQVHFTTIPELNTVRGRPIAKLHVGNAAGYLGEMLTRMTEKRGRRLNKPNVSGAKHTEDVMIGLSGDWDEPILLPFKNGLRASEGAGLTADGLVRTGKVYLVSTALAAIQQKIDREEGGSLIDGLKEKLDTFNPQTRVGRENKEIITACVGEAESILNGSLDLSSGQSAGFNGQDSNIDPVWLTFFVAVKVCKLTINDFYNWQRGIYIATRKLRGKGIDSILNLDPTTRNPGSH